MYVPLTSYKYAQIIMLTVVEKNNISTIPFLFDHIDGKNVAKYGKVVVKVSFYMVSKLWF